MKHEFVNKRHEKIDTEVVDVEIKFTEDEQKQMLSPEGWKFTLDLIEGKNIAKIIVFKEVKNG